MPYEATEAKDKTLIIFVYNSIIGSKFLYLVGSRRNRPRLITTCKNQLSQLSGRFLLLSISVPPKLKYQVIYSPPLGPPSVFFSILCLYLGDILFFFHLFISSYTSITDFILSYSSEDIYPETNYHRNMIPFFWNRTFFCNQYQNWRC